MTTKQLKQMIKWLRSERISYSSIIASGFELHGVVDGKSLDDVKPQPPVEKPSMYQRFGGPLLTQPTAKKSEVVPEEAQID